MSRLKIDGNGAIFGLALSLMVWLSQYILSTLNEVTIIQLRPQAAQQTYLDRCAPDSQPDYAARQVSVLLTGRQNIEKLSLMFVGNSDIERSCLFGIKPFLTEHNPVASNTEGGERRHRYIMERLPSGTEFVVVAMGTHLDILEVYIDSVNSDFSMTDRLLVSEGIVLPLLVKNREQVSIFAALVILVIMLLLGIKVVRVEER